MELYAKHVFIDPMHYRHDLVFLRPGDHIEPMFFGLLCSHGERAVAACVERIFQSFKEMVPVVMNKRSFARESGCVFQIAHSTTKLRSNSPKKTLFSWGY